jgi:capsular polysaccharide biosynthesis protein
MSQKPMTLRRSVQAVRRYKALIGAAVAIGVVCGAGYALLVPPTLTSNALVILPQPKPNIATQTLIAGSVPVFLGALPTLGSGESLETLQKKISVTDLTPNAIQVSAVDKTAALAEKDANAVAASYISYTGSSKSPVGAVVAHVLVSATMATGTSPTVSDVTDGGIGALAGALIGFLVALARIGADRRLRTRDDIASTVGVSVLASVPIEYPAEAAAWLRLLENYQPGAEQSWQLRRVLDRLGATGRGAGNHSLFITVLSLSADNKAFALGPHLAAFAASMGIQTMLVLGPQQGPDGLAELRAAYATASASSSQRLGNLRIVVGDATDSGWQHPGAELTIAVLGVDGSAPLVPSTVRASRTILGVSAGAVTAEQLARAAAAASDVGSRVAGVIVVDPDPDDASSGLVPNLARQDRRRLPTLVNGAVTEIR